MRNRDIAAALGLSKASVSMAIKRGMPRTNLEDIKAWRAGHLKVDPEDEERRFAKTATATPVTLKTLMAQARSEEAAAAPQVRRNAGNQLSALERLSQGEKQLSDDIESWTIALQETANASQPTDKIESRLALLRKEHAAAVKALLAAQKQSLEISVRRGELITAEASEAYTAAVLLPAIAAIRGMARYGASEAEKRRLAEISTMILDTMRESSATAAAIPKE